MTDIESFIDALQADPDEEFVIEPTMDDALQRAWRLWYEDPDDKRDLDQIVRDVFVAAPPDRLGPWLVNAVGAAELVAGLVEAGVLVQPTDRYSGALYWFADGEGFADDEYSDTRPADAVPLYRLADTRKADRG